MKKSILFFFLTSAAYAADPGNHLDTQHRSEKALGILEARRTHTTPSTFAAAQPRTEIDITGIDKKELLQRLFKAAKCETSSNESIVASLENDEIEKLLSFTIGKIHGRTLEINLSGDTINVYGYNHFNGDLAAEQVISELLTKGQGTKSASKK